MYIDLLEILRCPACGASFRLEDATCEGDEVITGTLACTCGERFGIRDGVAVFCAHEQAEANQWSELYQSQDYEALDRQLEARKSPAEKAQEERVLRVFLDAASAVPYGRMIDIASGRGMLLTRLAQAVQPDVHIIATDLSFLVLKYDRLKLQRLAPHARVSFIACDATAMPLVDACADMTTSFFGIANMLGIVDAGIREAARITKAGCPLLNAFLHIHEDSQGFRTASEACNASGLPGAARCFLAEHAANLHAQAFPDMVCMPVFEDVKALEEDRLDLLPYPGEWYANVVYRCTKG